MAITITWKERGQAFAGSFNAETVEAQFKDAVIRTAKDVLTIPYECVTSVKNGNEDAVSGTFNQTKFAKAIGIDFPVDLKLANVRLVLAKEVSGKLQIVGESVLQVVAKVEAVEAVPASEGVEAVEGVEGVEGEAAVFSVKFLNEAEATDFEVANASSAEGAEEITGEVKDNGTIVIQPVEGDVDVLVTLASA